MAIVTGVACSHETEARRATEPRPVLRLLHTWAIEPALTAQLEAAIKRALPGMRVDLRRPATTEDALVMLRRGEADAAFTFTTFAYNAQDEFRAIAELPARPVQVIVGPRVAIRSIADLRGRRVSIGRGGSNASLVAELLLKAFDLSLADVEAERLDLRDAVQRLIAGELDALFANVYANSDIDLAIRGGARILTIDGAEVDRARARYPLLKPTVVPPGNAAGVSGTHTVGIDEILLCRAGLDEQVAHALTRAIVDVVSRRDLDIEPLRLMNLGMASSTVIPLHPGAARYYRERELLP